MEPPVEDEYTCPTHREYRQIHQLTIQGLIVAYDVINNDYLRLYDFCINSNGAANAQALLMRFTAVMGWDSLRCMRCTDQILFRASAPTPDNNDLRYLSDENSYDTYVRVLTRLVNLLAGLDRNADRETVLRLSREAKQITQYIGGIRLILEEFQGEFNFIDGFRQLLDEIERLGVHMCVYNE